MRESPKDGMIRKIMAFAKTMASLPVGLYAANACFFIILSAIPGALLLLELLQHTPLSAEHLSQLLSGLLPEVLLENAREWIVSARPEASGTLVGLSAAAALLSSSRGIYGLMRGLNAIYDAAENRSYFHTRILCVVYTFGFLLVLLLTLVGHVFGTRLLSFLNTLPHPLVRLLTGVLDLRFFLLLFLQTAVFTAMFMVLPNRKNTCWQSVPGALLAALLWQIFSDLYSIYARICSDGRSAYGPVYVLGLGMLWLYGCIAIVFYGGAVNRYLSENGIFVNF